MTQVSITPDDARRRALERNLRLLCVFRGIQMSLFPVAIIALFIRDSLGLTMFEVFVLQGAFSVFTAVLEFPGGVVADRIGYRRSLVLASIVAVLGWALYSAASNVATILVCELLLAASLALTSGTDSALMYETLLELDRESSFGRWFGRARSVGAFAEGSAALVAGLLFVWWARLPFVVETIVWVGNVVVALLLVEPARDAPERRHLFTQARELVHYTFARVPKLRACTVTIVVVGLATFIPVWIVAPYARDAGLSAAWIGPMWAAANYSVALGNLGSEAWRVRLGLMPALVLCVLTIVAGYLGMGLTTAIYGFVFYFVICYARGVNGPILSHEQQRLIPSGDRAALLSVTSLVFRSVFAAMSPVLGSVTTAFGFPLRVAGDGGARRAARARESLLVPTCVARAKLGEAGAGVRVEEVHVIERDVERDRRPHGRDVVRLQPRDDGASTQYAVHHDLVTERLDHVDGHLEACAVARGAARRGDALGADAHRHRLSGLYARYLAREALGQRQRESIRLEDAVTHPVRGGSSSAGCR